MHRVEERFWLQVSRSSLLVPQLMRPPLFFLLCCAFCSGPWLGTSAVVVVVRPHLLKSPISAPL